MAKAKPEQPEEEKKEIPKEEPKKQKGLKLKGFECPYCQASGSDIEITKIKDRGPINKVYYICSGACKRDKIAEVPKKKD